MFEKEDQTFFDSDFEQLSFFINENKDAGEIDHSKKSLNEAEK